MGLITGASVAQDLEPEYITVSEDGQTAWIALQENNALAKLDIASATITDILPLGFKDYGLAGNGIDASDDDGLVEIRPRPRIPRCNRQVIGFQRPRILPREGQREAGGEPGERSER